MSATIKVLGWIALAGAGVSLATAVLAAVNGMPACATVLALSGLVNGWLSIAD